MVRINRQPALAVALLDREAARLDNSPYRHEALLVRVESLLALKRDADLLRLLDRTSLDDVAASRTLLSTRGRLRAAARRCAEAVADFDRVLAEPGRKDKQALLGRARCRETLGDFQGAQADRERYRQESQAAPGSVPSQH
jgi:Flp pilus assembly protein TadD